MKILNLIIIFISTSIIFGCSKTRVTPQLGTSLQKQNLKKSIHLKEKKYVISTQESTQQMQKKCMT